jgi:hypothetical protein
MPLIRLSCIDWGTWADLPATSDIMWLLYTTVPDESLDLLWHHLIALHLF